MPWDLLETYALLLMIEKLPPQLVMDGCRQDPSAADNVIKSMYVTINSPAGLFTEGVVL